MGKCGWTMGMSHPPLKRRESPFGCPLTPAKKGSLKERTPICSQFRDSPPDSLTWIAIFLENPPKRCPGSTLLSNENSRLDEQMLKGRYFTWTPCRLVGGFLGSCFKLKGKPKGQSWLFRESPEILWMDEILHHFETMGKHCLLVFTGESSF